MIFPWFFSFLQSSRAFNEIQWFFHDLETDLNSNDFSRAVGTLSMATAPLFRTQLIWGNKIDMDRIFVLPVAWNWHEMYLWLLPNEVQSYLGQTFTSMPTGIVKVPNHSLGSHLPKSAFALWQVWMNNCIFFSILINCSNNDLSNPYRY